MNNCALPIEHATDAISIISLVVAKTKNPTTMLSNPPPTPPPNLQISYFSYHSYHSLLIAITITINKKQQDKSKRDKKNPRTKFGQSIRLLLLILLFSKEWASTR